MTDHTPTDPSTLAWHPTSSHCPRCHSPVKARGTATFSKIIELICTKCGWRLQVEQIRIATKALLTPTEPDTEETPDGP